MFHEPQSTSNKKSICESRRSCTTCGALVIRGNHERYKRYCKIYSQNSDVGHLCYMRPLKDVLPANVLYIFYEFETRQNKTYSDTVKAHVTKLVCVQQICARCEEIDDCDIDCDRCGRRRHSFLNDTIGDLLNYLCEPCPWASKIFAKAHN